MKTITVRNKISKKEYNYTQLKSVEDINSYIDGDIEFSETRDIINDIITQRGVTRKKSDAVDCLIRMNENINNKLNEQLTTKRETILKIKKEGMIKLFNRYGEIWVNKVGGYTTTSKDYEIIN